MPMITRLRSGRGVRRNYAAMVGKRTTKPRLSKPAATAVSKVVKRVMSRGTETKYVSSQQDLSFNSTISSAAEAYPLCPAVPQGTDDYQRIGDKIKGKYLIIKGKVQYNTGFLDTAGTQFIPPSTCRVMILSQNNVKTSGDVLAGRVDVAHLLKDNVGTGAARPYSGTQYDNLAPINKDLFKVHMDKKIRLNWINHQIVVTDPGVSISHDVGNDRTKYFYCKIKLNKSMKFDDGTGNFPNAFAPFLCFGGVCDDGSSPWTASTPYRVTFSSTLYFQDA